MKGVLKLSFVTILAAVTLGIIFWSLGFTVSFSPAAKAQNLSHFYLPLVMKNYEQPATKTITVPAAAFIPARDNMQWHNMGSLLYGDGTLYAPVWFPSDGTLQSMTLYYYDDDSSADICVFLQRSRPSAGPPDLVGELCTTGASPYYPLSLSTSDFYDNQLRSERGYYLQLEISPVSLWAYQVEIAVSE